MEAITASVTTATPIAATLAAIAVAAKAAATAIPAAATAGAASTATTAAGEKFSLEKNSIGKKRKKRNPSWSAPSNGRVAWNRRLFLFYLLL